MAMRDERQEAFAEAKPVDDLLTRYVRALFRTGALAGRVAPHEDLRTCTHCGAYAPFEPVEDEATWAACSACGQTA